MSNHLDLSFGHTPDSDRMEVDTVNQQTHKQQHPATHVLASSDVNNNQTTHQNTISPVDEYMSRPTILGRTSLSPLPASTTTPVAPAVIDPDLTTAGMESDAYASVGGPGGGGSSNNKEARVAVGALCCASCGTSKTTLWRRDDVGNNICNACGEYILPNFLLSFISCFFSFLFLLLRFGGGAGELVFISNGFWQAAAILFILLGLVNFFTWRLHFRGFIPSRPISYCERFGTGSACRLFRPQLRTLINFFLVWIDRIRFFEMLSDLHDTDFFSLAGLFFNERDGY